MAAAFKSRAALQVENLALRHQLGVLRRSVKRPKLTSADRFLWAWLCEVWSDWRSSLVIVKPETVVAWHRKSFRLFWTWKVRHGQPGRPAIPKDVRELIRRLSRENPLWGAPRIHGELLKLGINVGETSVGKYMLRRRKPPSQTWRTFLDNHIKTMVSVDFFTVPTIRFQILYVFLVLAHDRRRILHFARHCASDGGVDCPATPRGPPLGCRCTSSSAGSRSDLRRWSSKQVKAMGIKEVLSAPRSPWQRAYVERLIGTIRRECLDHVIVFNEAQPAPAPRRSSWSTIIGTDVHWRWRRTLRSRDRSSRRSLAGSSRYPELGGLHHRYERRAA